VKRLYCSFVVDSLNDRLGHSEFVVNLARLYNIMLHFMDLRPRSRICGGVVRSNLRAACNFLIRSHAFRGMIFGSMFPHRCDSTSMFDIISDGTANANALRLHFLETESLTQTSLISPKQGESIIIVGAGAFGTSLALELVTNYRDK